MTSIREYYRTVTARLAAALSSQGEAAAAVSIIFEDVAGYSKTFIFANGDREITDSMQSRIKSVADRVVAGEPVQYAVGKARFMGNDFIVTPDVLIPRPETAGLVDMIVDRWGGRSDLDVCDVGTGSGCIAISLARALPFCRVTAIDVSAAAIAVARLNAASLKVNIDFVEADILTAVPPRGLYDIIVSNPPYVTQSESADMDARVLDYEPGAALFVPDDDPLRFYRAIAAYGRAALKSGGMLYFEINQNFPDKTVTLLESKGFIDVAAQRDFKGNYRYVSAVQP